MHIVIGQLAILAVSVSLVAGMAFATHEPLSADEIIRWRQDLRVLATELPALHKNAFQTSRKHHSNFTQTLFQLHVNFMQTSHKPYTNFMQTLC